MSQVLIKHKVNDYDAWKAVFDNFADFRRSSGEKSYRILHQIDDPNDLTILFEWDTQNNAETFLASHELKSAMQEAGVAETPKIQFLNEAANGSL
jgi:heme-degrading monooxygenase HmoA